MFLPSHQQHPEDVSTKPTATLKMVTELVPEMSVNLQIITRLPAREHFITV